MYYIGIDLGTSAVKLLLMEESGKICNIVSREYPLFFPHPGWSEQKPEDWFAQSMEGMKELTKDIDRAQVAGIGFGGQMHGLVTLDKDDNVIRPAILWNAGRTGEETEYLNTVIGKDKLSQDVYKRQEYIASLYNCEIEIIDNTEKSEQQELVEDLVQIITVFSCKLQGKRANKAKKLIRELIQEEADGKSHKSNVDTK